MVLILAKHNPIRVIRKHKNATCLPMQALDAQTYFCVKATGSTYCSMANAIMAFGEKVPNEKFEINA